MHKKIDAAISQRGFDNFYGEFSILGHLVDKLSKALARSEKLHKAQLKNKAQSRDLEEKFTEKKAEEKSTKSMTKRSQAFKEALVACIGLHNYFSLCIKQ